MTQLQRSGGIVEKLNQEKFTANAESLEGVERKKTYAEVQSKVVPNTVLTYLKLENTDKDKTMEWNVLKANYSLCGDNKIEGGCFELKKKNFSDGKTNRFTPEIEQKVEGRVFFSQYINGSRESNCNVGGSITTDEPSINRATLTDEQRVSLFCSRTVFNLSHKILTEIELKLLEKGLDFAPVKRTLNQSGLRKDSEEICRRMRYKWHFCNEVFETFGEIPAFRPKSSWLPPKGHAKLKIFLCQLEK